LDGWLGRLAWWPFSGSRSRARAQARHHPRVNNAFERDVRGNREWSLRPATPPADLGDMRVLGNSSHANKPAT
jgi:hypothetical protein